MSTSREEGRTDLVETVDRLQRSLCARHGGLRTAGAEATDLHAHRAGLDQPASADPAAAVARLRPRVVGPDGDGFAVAAMARAGLYCRRHCFPGFRT